MPLFCVLFCVCLAEGKLIVTSMSVAAGHLASGALMQTWWLSTFLPSEPFSHLPFISNLASVAIYGFFPPITLWRQVTNSGSIYWLFLPMQVIILRSSLAAAEQFVTVLSCRIFIYKDVILCSAIGSVIIISLVFPCQHHKVKIQLLHEFPLLGNLNRWLCLILSRKRNIHLFFFFSINAGYNTAIKIKRAHWSASLKLEMGTGVLFHYGCSRCVQARENSFITVKYICLSSCTVGHEQLSLMSHWMEQKISN